MNKILSGLKKFWSFLKQDTWQSWIVSLVLAFILIKLVFFPLLSWAFGSPLPLVVVESCSMYHQDDFESWWSRNGVWYEEQGNFATDGENRLIVELPGITDLEKAVAMIGQTPLLEFKVERPEGPEKEKLLKDLEALQKRFEAGEDISGVTPPDPYYISTDLTGRYLKTSAVDFGQSGQPGGNFGSPVVTLTFDKTGADLFEKLTKENIGKTVAIYLDGSPISTPVVNSAISGGQAIITGNFTPEEAKQLVGRLNSGALPVPIELVSTQSIGPSLGGEATQAGVFARGPPQ